MAGVKRILQSSSVYTILAFLPTASRILLLPIYLVFLTPSDFALISLNSLVASLLPLIMTLGLDTAYVRFYFEYKHSKKLSDTYFSTITLTIFGIAFVITLLSIPIGDFAFKQIFKGKDLTFFPYGITAVLFALVSSINSVFMGAYRNKQELKNFTIFSLGILIASTLSEAIAILCFRFGPDKIILLKLIAVSIFSVVIWIKTFLKTGISFDKRFLPQSIKYSLPMLPYSFSAFIFTSFDRIMIENNFSGNRVPLAVYNLGAAIANITETIMFAIQSATYPTVYEFLKKGYKTHIENISKIYRIIGLGVLMVIGLLIALSPIGIINFLQQRPEYIASLTVIPILLMAFYFRYLYIVFVEPLFFFKNTKKLPWLNILLGVTTIVGNILLLPKYGIIGSAITFAGARFLQLMLTVYWYKKVSDLRFHLKYLYGLMAASALSVILCTIVNNFYIHNKLLVYMVNFIPLLLILVFAILFIAKGKINFLDSKNFAVIKNNL